MVDWTTHKGSLVVFVTVQVIADLFSAADDEFCCHVSSNSNHVLYLRLAFLTNFVPVLTA